MDRAEMNFEWRMKMGLKLFALAGAKPFHQSTPEEIRARDNAKESWISDFFLGPRPAVPNVIDRTMTTRHGEIPMRIYSLGKDEHGKLRPIFFFIHGGGFVVGNIKTYDRLCRRLALATGHQVVLFEYHKAPEYKFPVGVEDCWDTLQWVATNGQEFDGDVRQISIGGDSAGGNLTAVMTQMCRDRNGPKLHKQVLIYPAVDFTRSYPSEERYADAPIVGRKDILWFGAHYLSTNEENADPRCSPLVGEVSNLPPALVLTAEFDPLTDQGKAYAQKLKDAGGTALYKLFPRQPHGFMVLSGLSTQAEAAYQEIGRFLKSDC